MSVLRRGNPMRTGSKMDRLKSLRNLFLRAGQRKRRDEVVAFSPQVPVPVCPECGGSGFTLLVVPFGHQDFGQAHPCRCVLKAVLERYLNHLPPLTFEGFEANAVNCVAYGAALAMAEGRHERPWLILAGQPGVGKTHLAVAVLRVRAEAGQMGRFEVVPDMLAWLRAGIGQEISAEERLESLKRCPLLVLDDLGKEKGTEWAEQIIYQLLDYRYRYRLDTVVTINGSLSAFPDAVRDRLLDNHLCRVVMIEGTSYRSGMSYGGK